MCSDVGEERRIEWNIVLDVASYSIFKNMSSICIERSYTYINPDCFKISSMIRSYRVIILTISTVMEGQCISLRLLF